MSFDRNNLMTLCVAATLGLSACSSNGPSGPGAEAFDAQQTAANLDAVDATFETPAFQSLEVLGERFETPAAAMALAAADLIQSSNTMTRRPLSDRAEELGQRLNGALASSTSASAPIIPPDWFGRVYIYDQGEEAYVLDPEQTGPDNGIRFVLYAVNPINHDILADTEIGYADVLDEGTDNSTSVRLIVVSEEMEYVNYAITATGVINAPVFEIDGFVTDGINTVDFMLRHAVAITIGSTDIAVDYDVTVDELDFQFVVDLDVSADESGGSVTLNITVINGANIVVLTGTLTDEIGQIAITGNGTVFATITIDETGITVTDAEGNPLNEADAEALQNLFELVDDVFTVFEELFSPLDWLFNDFGG